jgi:DGQHR domain-containing protein
MAMISKKKARKAMKPKLSADEREQQRIKREHAKIIRSPFLLAGFKLVQSISDKEFTFSGTTSDFDDIFILENVIVLVERTISQESNVSQHLRNKKVVYDKIKSDVVGFITFMRNNFPALKEAMGVKYQPHHYRVEIIYCSLNSVKSETKEQVKCVKYFDYNVARYFNLIAKTVRESSKFELLAFLGLDKKDFADGVLNRSSDQFDVYHGSILPETYSNFGHGFKVVSFYVDPATLLQRAYVLRKYGWRDGDAVYQRMVSQTKIADIRKYLRDQKRVFINNIIVTLPDDTKLINQNGDTIDPNQILDTEPCRIQIPNRYNLIGIVDGQHRVFSYHEGGLFDERISNLRHQQNLLVTGIVFPPSMTEEDRLKFEANLFLEINSNQTNAKSDLKQEINIIINPFSAESIARKVVNYMNDCPGPLRDEFERFFFENDKLKTTSVVSFAVRPIVNPTKSNSLYGVWKHANKAQLANCTDQTLLAEYVQFCATEINHILAGVRASLDKSLWTADRKLQNRFLTTTNVNGVISCLRRLVANGKVYTVEEYREKFRDLANFDFGKYHSSQYNRMGEELEKLYFS